MQEDLYDQTLELLSQSPKTIPVIAAETGLKQRWLYRLLDGDFSDPGVRKIQKLHTYLSQQAPKKNGRK